MSQTADSMGALNSEGRLECQRASLIDLRKRVVAVMGAAKSRDKVILEDDTLVRYVVRLNDAAKCAQASTRIRRMSRGLREHGFGIGKAVALALALVPSLGYWRGSMGKSGLFRCH